LLRRDKQERSEIITIILNDGAQVELKPNSVFKYESLESVVKICIKGDCFDMHLSKKHVNYFQCSWRVKANVPSLEKMDLKAGVFYTNEIENSEK
jgi:hypothetical protein